MEEGPTLKSSSDNKSDLSIKVLESEDCEGFVVEVIQSGERREMCIRGQDLKELHFHMRKTYPKKGLVPKGFKIWKFRKKSEGAKLRDSYNFMLNRAVRDGAMRKDPVLCHMFRLDGFNKRSNTLRNSDNNLNNKMALVKMEENMKESLNYMCNTLKQQSAGFSFSKAESLLDVEQAKQLLKLQAFEDASTYNSLIQQSNRVITLMREYLGDAEEMLGDIRLAIDKRDANLLTTRLAELTEEADAAYKRAEALEVEYENFMFDIETKITELKNRLKAAKDRKEAINKSSAMMFVSTVIPSLLLLPLTVPNALPRFNPSTALRNQVARAMLSSGEFMTKETIQGECISSEGCIDINLIEELNLTENNNRSTNNHHNDNNHNCHNAIVNLDLDSYNNPIQILALPFKLCGVVEEEDEGGFEDMDRLFERVYHLYKKADNRLREQTLNWKKLVVALEGLKMHSAAIKQSDSAWDSLEGLSEDLAVAAGNYRGLRVEVENYIKYLKEKGITPLLPERRTI